MTGAGLRVLAVTNMYPTAVDSAYGSFVATQMESVKLAGAVVDIEFINGRRGTLEYARGVGRVRRCSATGQYDVVHAHYGLTGFVASFQPLPLVVSYCGDDLNGTSNGRGGVTLKSRVARTLSHLAARRADAIICKSERLRRSLPRAADRDRAHVIANGVDVNRFSPGDRRDARQRLGLPQDTRLVLFPHSRRQQAVKRFDIAEAAVRQLARNGSAADLWVVNGISPEAMPDYYRSADCLLLTSDTEGSPNVVKEALCCDLPVVSVDVGDVRQWVDLAPGCRIVARDPAALAGALAEVMGTTRFVDGSRVREELALDRVAHRIIGVYREAIRNRERGAPPRAEDP